MEALRQVKLKSLEPYRSLFPPAKATDETRKMGASVQDTVDFIPQVVQSCAWQVEKFVDQELRGLPVYQTCEKLWNWVKYHIRYQKDQRGLEQVRSPRRLVHDGYGDCDCFTTFIGTCLYVLKIPVINRITKYKEDYFQHIYPIVPLGNGKHIIMDCVVDRFNYEEPYSEKKDYKMDLQFLDGIDDDGLPQFKGIDAQDLFGWGDFGELGKLLKKKSASPGAPAPAKKGIFKKAAPPPGAPAKKGIFKKPAGPKKPIGQKLKTVAKKSVKVLNKINKINPATVLLRAGILASMKLNVMKVAEKLKWGYLSKEEAGKRGMDISKYDKLKYVRTKTEGIFFAAGGNKDNLKKAILTGKGNKNHEVSGIDGLGEYTPLPEMLGDVYQDEFVNGMDGFAGFGELGEPATAASLAAASTAIGSLAALLKSIGDLFPKKKQKAAATETPASEPEPTVETSSGESPSEPEPSETESSITEESENNLPAVVEETETAVEEAGEELMDEGTNGKPAKKMNTPATQSTGIKLFWEKNKSWIKPVGIGAIVAGVCVAGFKMMGSNREPPRSPSYPGPPGLSGFRKRKKKRKGKRKNKFAHKNKIALM